MEQDPVCGMQVDPKTAFSTVRDGLTHYFCSPGCKKQFEDNPGQYAKG